MIYDMEMSDVKVKKRKTIKSKICPNPLFEKWLLEWKDEANQRDSKLKFTYSRVSHIFKPVYHILLCLIIKYKMLVV